MTKLSDIVTAVKAQYPDWIAYRSAQRDAISQELRPLLVNYMVEKDTDDIPPVFLSPREFLMLIEELGARIAYATAEVKGLTKGVKVIQLDVGPGKVGVLMDPAMTDP